MHADDVGPEVAKRLLSEGRIKPLSEILNSVKRQIPGKMIEVELELEDGKYVYEFKLLRPDGRCRKSKPTPLRQDIQGRGRRLMRLLVVEDEPRISDGIKSALDAAGYTCDVSADGEDAWFRGDTEAYDLVVLDLGLPKLDGLAVLKRWRADGRNMPVLVLTARGAWPERVEGIDAGADDYLAKPFRTEELLARVRALIRRSSGREMR